MRVMKVVMVWGRGDRRKIGEKSQLTVQQDFNTKEGQTPPSPVTLFPPPNYILKTPGSFHRPLPSYTRGPRRCPCSGLSRQLSNLHLQTPSPPAARSSSGGRLSPSQRAAQPGRRRSGLKSGSLLGTCSECPVPGSQLDYCETALCCRSSSGPTATVAAGTPPDCTSGHLEERPCPRVACTCSCAGSSSLQEQLVGTSRIQPAGGCHTGGLESVTVWHSHHRSSSNATTRAF